MTILTLAMFLTSPSISIANETKNVKAFDLLALKENEPKVIWCINSITFKTKWVNKDWNCLYWQNWQNIMLPPKSHISKWESIYWDDWRKIVNRLPIANFESWFDPKAENPFAIWYVQTLKKYKVWTKITEQLQWLKDRQDYQKQEYIIGSKWQKLPACGVYWKKNNTRDWFKAGEEGVMSCLYRWHYHAEDWTKYSQKLMSARKYYFNYIENVLKNIDV